MKKRLAVFLVVALIAPVAPVSAVVTDVTLSDGNAEAKVQLDTSAGMYSWVVDGGANQLFTQWFWWRVGDSGPERPVSDLALTTYSQPSANFVTSTYAHGDGLFTVTITYTLSGGAPGSGLAQIGETISINNISGAALELHFFQYTDFDLGGAPGGETAFIGAGGGGFNYAAVVESAFNYTENITSPAAQRAEAALFDSTALKLGDADADDLNNVLSAGPGDVTFAFQWDAVLAATGLGSSLEIVKNKSLTVPPIPEPTAAGLLGLAGLALLARGRRRCRD